MKKISRNNFLSSYPVYHDFHSLAINHLNSNYCSYCKVDEVKDYLKSSLSSD